MTQPTDILAVMGAPKLRPQPAEDMGSFAHEAVVYDTPTHSTQPIRVIIPSFDPKQLWGPCPWSPIILDSTELAFPSEDDRALVVISSEENPWIVTWWPDTVYSYDDDSVS